MKKFIVLLILSFGIIFSVSADELENKGIKCADATGKTCLENKNFEINVGILTPSNPDSPIFKDLKTGIEKPGSSGLVDGFNSFVNFFIRTLLIIIIGFSALVMAIGAGYVILYHGSDDMLNKGKNLFKMGLISIAVALSAGLILKIIQLILISITTYTI